MKMLKRNQQGWIKRKFKIQLLLQMKLLINTDIVSYKLFILILFALNVEVNKLVLSFTTFSVFYL